MRVINSFRGHYAFLSNFFVGAPFVDYNGTEWKTSEHYYQAQKVLSPEKILKAETPGEAKRLSRELPSRPDWHEVKVDIMYTALRMKFEQWPKYKDYLIQTEDYKLVEGNWWHDNFWGDCYCDKCENIVGQNMLGTLLMKLRNRLIWQEGR